MIILLKTNILKYKVQLAYAISLFILCSEKKTSISIILSIMMYTGMSDLDLLKTLTNDVTVIQRNGTRE